MSGKKRPREQHNVDVQAIEIFEDLANENQEIRLKAAVALLSKYSGEATVEQIDKTFKRLIRGLCSGRKAARLGFSVALTEFLVEHCQTGSTRAEGLSVEYVITTLIEQTRITGNIAGQEERDYHLGRLFGAEAVIKSGIVFLNNQNFDQWERLLDVIFTLAKKKSWLREECGWILHSLIQRLSPQESVVEYVEILIAVLVRNKLSRTPEGAALWTTARSCFPNMKFPPKTSKSWHRNDPLHKKMIPQVAQILNESPVEDEVHNPPSKIVARGPWQSKPHFAWDVVLRALLENDLDKLDHLKYKHFAQFWKETVESCLFASNASHERKYLGFQLFRKYVLIVPSPKIHNLFGFSFRGCFMNQLASQERYLHQIAEQSLKAIYSRVQDDPLAAGTIIRCLTDESDHGANSSSSFVNFDFLSKTKTVERLLGEVPLESLADTLHYFDTLIRHPGSQADENAAFAVRHTLADQLLHIIRSRSYPATSEYEYEIHKDCVTKITEIFIGYGYFDGTLPSVGDGLEPPICNKTRDLFRSRLMSSLAHLIIKAPNPEYHPFEVVRCFGMRAEVDPKGLAVDLQASSTDIRSTIALGWQTLQAIVIQEEIVDSEKLPHLKAFKLLISLLLLQVYNGDAEAAEMFQDVQSCYDDLVKRSRNDGESEASEILVEVILSLTSKPPVLFKRLAQQVFSVCTSTINKNGLQSMVKVLRTKESISGQEELFDHVENGSGLDESDSEDEDDDSEDEDDDSKGDAVDGAEEVEEEEEEEAENDESAASDAKLAKTLGTRRADEDLLMKDIEESSDEDMDDDQMAALDVHIANIFRERKNAPNKKTQRKEAKETIILFKSRVLDLLETYIKAEYETIQPLSLLSPLLSLIRTTTHKPLADKTCSIVRTYSKLYKLATNPSTRLHPAEINIAKATLDDVHTAAGREGSNAYGAACSQASLLVAKVLINAEEKDCVVDAYARLQNRFLGDRTCHVRTAFFSDWLNWCTSARRVLAGGGGVEEA